MENNLPISKIALSLIALGNVACSIVYVLLLHEMIGEFVLSKTKRSLNPVHGNLAKLCKLSDYFQI